MVIAPIACSDLRGPETLSDEEILNEKITLTEFVMEINGKEVMNANEPGVSVSTQGLGAIALSPKDYGLFEFSIRPFDGAIQAGSISDNTVEFKVNQLNVSIASTQKILENNSDAMIWVRHFPNAKIAEGFSSYGDANQPPPPPPPTEAPQDTDRDIFVVVESMPELIRGQAGVQAKVKYPQAAIRAGIEGRVTVQFIVDKNGNVVDPKVIRGIGGGCDEEALRVVSQAKFKPGVQRGRNVEVQMSLPVLFRLNNSEFKQSNDSETPPPPPIKVETLESSNGTVKVKLSNTFGPLVGASVNIEGTKKGAATNLEGIAVITGLEKGTHKFIFSYVGHGQPIKEITVK
jgi:TonB family protein